MLPLLVRWPNDLLEFVAYCAYRSWSERRAGWALVKSLLRRRAASVRPLLLVVHKFMDAAELESPIGQERLQACVFKVPVGDRMVSMCEVNVKERLSLNLKMISPKFKDRIADTLLSEAVN